MTTYDTYDVLVSGIGFPESLRWFDDALWYADWAAGAVFRVGRRADPHRPSRVRPSFPLCFDLLADRRRSSAAAGLEPGSGRAARPVPRG